MLHLGKSSPERLVNALQHDLVPKDQEASIPWHGTLPPGSSTFGPKPHGDTAATYSRAKPRLGTCLRIKDQFLGAHTGLHEERAFRRTYRATGSTDDWRKSPIAC